MRFLDIVANLVGILIILVVVVGAQATVVWQKPNDSEKHQAELEEVANLTERKYEEFESIRLENHELRGKLREEEAINQQLETIRHQILVALESRRREIDLQTSKLNQAQQASLIAENQVRELQNKIKQVRYETAAVDENLKPTLETIEHFPTPIARTVFSDEVHFRIKDGRIVYVPLDELVDSMKRNLRLNLDQIRNAENTTDLVGPINNFQLRFETELIRDPQTGGKLGVQLKRFELLPVNAQIGEEIQNALTSGSGFRRRLRQRVPEKTTISLWVYPDAYYDLEKVQSWLRESGFQTACWPLKYEGLIGGSPQGFRTTTN